MGHRLHNCVGPINIRVLEVPQKIDLKSQVGGTGNSQRLGISGNLKELKFST